jgi:hypothetical protein
MRLAIILISFLSLYPTCLLAKETVTGRYAGTLQGTTTSGRVVFVGVAIEIWEIRGEAIKGNMARLSGWGKCGGQGAAGGTLKRDKIVFESLAEIGIPGCGRPRASGTLAGDSFIGEWESQATKLSKQLPAAEGLVTW